MKRGGPDHPKVHALAAALGIDRWGAVGILECLFHWTAAYAPDGGIGKWSDEAIATGIGWVGDARSLLSALETTGWVDRAHDPCTRRVHGWSDHADDATHMKLARARLTFADGSEPKLTRLPKHEKTAAIAFYKARAHAVHTPCVNRVTSPPLPSPPLPSNVNTPLSPPKGGQPVHSNGRSRRQRPLTPEEAVAAALRGLERDAH